MIDQLPTVIPGQRRTADVPDTIDLAKRGELAVNGLGGNIDQNLMTMYGHIWFCAKRPHFSHWASADTSLDVKFAESFPLMRLMSGSEQYADLERRFRDAVLSRVDDGLFWDRADPRRPWRNSYSTEFYGDGKNEDFSSSWGTGRMMRALLVWRELGGGIDCDRLLDELCAGLRRILVVKGEYGYYPEKGGWGEPCAYPRSGWLNTAEAKSDTEGGEGAVTAFHGHQLYGAAHWYELTGSPVALDLATKLANYCLLPRFWGGVPDPAGKRDGLAFWVAPCRSDPPFTAGSEQGHWYSHFHSRAITLRGLLAFGRATANARVLEFVRRAYEFSLSQGIPRMGWINCYPAAQNQMEGCALGDIVGLAIRLSDAGLGDYWDDVDAVVRNQLVEQQLTDGAALERIVAHFKNHPELARWQPDPDQPNTPPGQNCFDNIIPRSLGVFAGHSLPNSIIQPWVMHCCTGNATQGLYYAWEGALREEGDRATVNLLQNRAGRLVDVESDLPHAGRVIVRNRAARRVALRVPAWTSRREIRLQVGGSDRPLDWVGNYLFVSDLKPGEIVELTFPIRETTARYTVNAQSPAEMSYTCTFRGSTLVDISPRDTAPTSLQLYRREAQRQSAVPLLRQVPRFVPDRVVRGW